MYIINSADVFYFPVFHDMRDREDGKLNYYSLSLCQTGRRIDKQVETCIKYSEIAGAVCETCRTDSAGNFKPNSLHLFERSWTMRRQKALFSLILLAGFVALLILATAGGAYSEEPSETQRLLDEKEINALNEYHYPAGNRTFYLPRYHEVKFDVHNGKYFLVRHIHYQGADISDIKELQDNHYTVYFYTPLGKLFAIRRINSLDLNRYHSIPHDARTPNYSRLIVKVQNNTDYNKDISFRVMETINPVKGTPIKGATYRMILLD